MRFFFGFSHFFAAWGSSLLYILPEAAAAEIRQSTRYYAGLLG
jgi:hypothetical protein